MNDALRLLALACLDLVLLAGWIAIPLGLSGNFILLGAALVTALATRFTAVGWLALLIMGLAVVAGEVIEAFLGSLTARRFGASKHGMIGAFVGGLAGGVLGTTALPIIGSLIGSFAGAGAGAIAGELTRGRTARDGARAGWGAFLGRVASTCIKMAIGTGIIVYLVIRTHGGFGK